VISTKSLECPLKSGSCFEPGLAPWIRSRMMAKRAKPEEIIAKLSELAPNWIEQLGIDERA
jgi:hypothetical protein